MWPSGGAPSVGVGGEAGEGRPSRAGHHAGPLGAAVAPSAAGPRAKPWGTPQSQPPPAGEGACRQALGNLCVLDRPLLTLGSRGPHITDGETGSESPGLLRAQRPTAGGPPSFSPAGRPH